MCGLCSPATAHSQLRHVYELRAGVGVTVVSATAFVLVIRLTWRVPPAEAERRCAVFCARRTPHRSVVGIESCIGRRVGARCVPAVGNCRQVACASRCSAVVLQGTVRHRRFTWAWLHSQRGRKGRTVVAACPVQVCGVVPRVTVAATGVAARTSRCGTLSSCGNLRGGNTGRPRVEIQ
jgi:hypothetical protein